MEILFLLKNSGELGEESSTDVQVEGGKTIRFWLQAEMIKYGIIFGYLISIIL